MPPGNPNARCRAYMTACLLQGTVVFIAWKASCPWREVFLIEGKGYPEAQRPGHRGRGVVLFIPKKASSGGLYCTTKRLATRPAVVWACTEYTPGARPASGRSRVSAVPAASVRVYTVRPRLSTTATAVAAVPRSAIGSSRVAEAWAGLGYTLARRARAAGAVASTRASVVKGRC